MNHRMLFEAVRDAVQRTGEGRARLSRRRFLKLAGTGGSALVLAAVVPVGRHSGLQAQAIQDERVDLVASAELNAFISVSSDGKITIYSANAEMGQGIKTALPMVIAEEMGAAWEDVEVLQAPVDEETYGRQFAGGSTTVARTWDQMRELGASAREMFISAGSLVMEVPREELHTEQSRVIHDTGRFMTFGQLATLAAKQDVPDPEVLIFKERQDYTLIGTSVSGVDNLVITTGLALFGIDVRVPDMLYAAYQKCPAIGGRVLSANLEVIRSMPGVVDAFLVRGNGDVRELLDGVAIVGTNTWAVFNAKQRLEVRWDESSASKDSWTGMVKKAEELRGTRGPDIVLDKGDVQAVYDSAANTTLEAFYEYPFVAHLCMEPMNCSAHWKPGSGDEKDRVELWIPTQGPGRAYPVMKSMFGLEQDQVTVHQMRLGGSFGRRVYTEYVCEATEISRRMKAPVKLTWNREDDIRHDFYRVGGFQSVKGSVDGEGRLIAFEDHYIGMQTDGEAVSGSRFPPTEFPLLNVRNAFASKTLFDIRTPCGPWRAPGSNTTAFVIQSFLDELAHAGGRDYRDFLLEILGERRWFDEGNIRSLNTGRAADVVRLVTEKAGWGRSMPAGRGLGLAFYFSHAAHVAEVAEVSVSADKRLTVHRVTVAVDVGPIINMSGATSQVEGAVIDGLSTMLAQKITMEGGRTQQSNFHDYQVLRIPEAPPVDIHFIQSDNPPTGLGEPALPPLAPAVGNAIFAASGERVRKMPLSDAGYRV
ncbi:MAG: molybdopterin cofactor-binding domain-containing protein [Pseudomonadales bacterium]|nr:xanthine dehydrogenase family protein molybdopterin-binding subunit [Pseudomonadales bacterium]